MSIRVMTPRSHDGSFAEAHALAKAEAEPIFVPLRHFCDDRGWSLMNLMTGVLSPEGQINFSMQYPGIIKAWHRHDFQTDFWLCPVGHIKVGCYRESDHQAWSVVIGEKKPGIVIIPPPLWHGAATVGGQPAGLLYYVTRAFDARQPDEHRRAYDSVAGFPWEPEFK